jgi:small subunit ribosomal protein S9
MAKANIVNTTGRRKTSVARANIVKGKGSILVNNQKLEEYFNNDLLRLKAREPLVIADAESKYDIMVNVFGGGVNSQ